MPGLISRINRISVKFTDLVIIIVVGMMMRVTKNGMTRFQSMPSSLKKHNSYKSIMKGNVIVISFENIAGMTAANERI